jgi:uncharacterized protein (DUF488 family)
MDVVYTIGHSTHSQEHFMALLTQHGITALCDVRSRPYSRICPQFGRQALQLALKSVAIEYVFLGKELGGRSEDPHVGDNGKVEYCRLADTGVFKRGIRRLREGLTSYRLALMCAEKDPLNCHRGILIARHLVAVGIDVTHIHGDGSLETHADALRRLALMLGLSERHMFIQDEHVTEEAYARQEDRIAYRYAASASTRALAGGRARR